VSWQPQSPELLRLMTACSLFTKATEELLSRSLGRREIRTRDLLWSQISEKKLSPPYRQGPPSRSESEWIFMLHPWQYQGQAGLDCRRVTSLFHILLHVPSQYPQKESGACSFWQNFHFSEKGKKYCTLPKKRYKRDVKKNIWFGKTEWKGSHKSKWWHLVTVLQI